MCPDWEHTSLKPYVEMLERHASAIMNDSRERKRGQSLIRTAFHCADPYGCSHGRKVLGFLKTEDRHISTLYFAFALFHLGVCLYKYINELSILQQPIVTAYTIAAFGGHYLCLGAGVLLEKRLREYWLSKRSK